MAKDTGEILNQFKENQEEKVVNASKKLRVGIIGTGWIAGAHIKCYKEMPDVEIVAGADLIEGKAEAFFKKWGVEGVRCYPDHKSMLIKKKTSSKQVKAISKQDPISY